MVYLDYTPLRAVVAGATALMAGVDTPAINTTPLCKSVTRQSLEITVSQLETSTPPPSSTSRLVITPSSMIAA